MKITEKIVTSVTLPQHTNVLWHNPETGELKMFGDSGWEVVGGGELPELPEIIESGWVLDKETMSIAAKVAVEVPNTCSYESSGLFGGWKFANNPNLSAGESYELVEVGTDNKVSVVFIGMNYTPIGDYHKFEGDLDTSKTYSYGTYDVGFTNNASGLGSVASGNSTTASGKGSHAEGNGTTASGHGSHVEGYYTTASGQSSHAEGQNTTASGYASHAEGDNTTASGDYSHAEGQDTTAEGSNSHAEGQNTTATGYYSHAEGSYTAASGQSSHAEGGGTTASGNCSHAEGCYTTASSDHQHVQGKYNIDDPDGVYQFIIGNGNGARRSNALAVKWDGTIVLWKDVNTPLELTPDKLEKLLALVD